MRSASRPVRLLVTLSLDRSAVGASSSTTDRRKRGSKETHLVQRGEVVGRGNEESLIHSRMIEIVRDGREQRYHYLQQVKMSVYLKAERADSEASDRQ